MKIPSVFHESLELRNWWIVTEVLNQMSISINSSLEDFGARAGYSALHIAVLEGNYTSVRKLIKNYKANVESRGEDGANPLQLAILLNHDVVADTLLHFGADPFGQLPKKLFEKYGGDQEFPKDFGSISLVTFAIINKNPGLAGCLLRKRGCNFPEIDEKSLIKFVMDGNHAVRNEVINYGNFSINLYDLAIFNQKIPKFVNEKLLEVFREKFKGLGRFRFGNRLKIKESNDFLMLIDFVEILYVKIERAVRRKKLLKELEKIKILREVISLPYEIILMIIEYVDDNKSLENFIEAFYQKV